MTGRARDLIAASFHRIAELSLQVPALDAPLALRVFIQAVIREATTALELAREVAERHDHLTGERPQENADGPRYH